MILRYSTDTKIEPDAYPLHSHDMYELYYLENGNVTYRVEGQVYKLLPGSVLLMRPGEIHCPHIHSGTPYARLTIHFSADILTGVDPFLLLLDPFDKRCHGQKNLYPPQELSGEAMTAIQTLCSTTDSGTAENLKIRLALFSLLYCLRTAFYGKEDAPLSIGEKLVRFIDENLTGALSLDILSKSFYLSGSQCERLFRQATGSSVYKYITLKRLNLAKQMLLCGTSPGAVCSKCGFGDYSAFYRAYVRHFSVSPYADKTKQKHSSKSM